MPGYAITLEGEYVLFRNRETMEIEKTATTQYSLIILDHEVYHDPRQVETGWNINLLEQKWRNRIENLLHRDNA